MSFARFAPLPSGGGYRSGGHWLCLLLFLTLMTGAPVPAQCPPGNLPGPVDGLGSGPGSVDRTFGYPTGNTPTFSTLVSRIGTKFSIPVSGDIRASAVQRLGGDADKIILGGKFVYTVPGGPTYRNLIRLNPNGTVDTTFTPPASPVVNALAVDSADRIVVGAETAPRLRRLLPGGAVDSGFTPPSSITAAVLAVEVDPSDNVYVGLNGGTIGVAPTIKQNFARLTPGGAIDTSGFWGTPSAPNFPVAVNGPVRSIRYGASVYFPGLPGVVIGGQFTASSGGNPGLSPLPNIALYDLNGQVDTFLQFSLPGGTNQPVNALAVLPNAPLDDIFAGGGFSSFASASSPRLVKFNAAGVVGGFNIPPATAAQLPNPIRSLALTNNTPTFTAVFPPNPTLSVVHAGGTQVTATASANVAVDATSGAPIATPATLSPFFDANRPAAVLTITANTGNGALFGGEFLNANTQKIVTTFNPLYAPPAAITAGVPGFESKLFGPAQFHASLLLPNGDLLVGGDVGPAGDSTLPVDDPDNLTAELYRLTPCGNVTVLARFRNISGYVVRNDVDNGIAVSPPADINTTPGVGYRRIDNVDPPSIRALALAPGGQIYVGGQFNQVGPGSSGPFFPTNNLVRLLPANGNIDPTFPVGFVDPNPVPGYPVLQLGGPTGFGLSGTGFSTVDPASIQPPLTGTCGAPPPPLPAGIGEKFNPNDGRVNAIAVYSDGRVLIAGEFKAYNQVARSGLARLLPNGALDTSFGIPGSGVGDYELCGTPAAPGATPRNDPQVAYQRARINTLLLDESTGQITVGGLFATANGIIRYNVARFNADGSLDTTFAAGPAGTVHPTGTTGLPAAAVTGPNQGATSNGRGGEVFAMARQTVGGNAGRLVLGGAFTAVVNSSGTAAFTPRRALIRLLTSGTQIGHLDASFNGHLVFNPPSVNPEVRALALDAQDRILIGGPFRLGPRDTVPSNGLGYITNNTRGRLHRLSPDGGFADGFTALNTPAPVWQSVPAGVPLTPLFQPGPYAVQLSGLPASIFGSGGSEISYFPTGAFSGAAPFGVRYTDGDISVNSLTLDTTRRRVYAVGLFNVFESLRGDAFTDNGGNPGGLGRNILWPGVAALQTNCAYGAVQAQVTPLQPVNPGDTLTLPAVSPSGAQFPVLTITRSAASQCLATPVINTSSSFVTIVGAIPNPVNPGFLDIVVSVGANTTGSQRTGQVTVVIPSEGTPGSPVTVNFDQAPASGCVFASTATPSNFPAGGGSGQFQITTGTGCGWTITGVPAWITPAVTSGSGSGTVNFTVASNGGVPRSATLNVAGQSITITQAGTCTLSLGAPSPATLPATGGSGSFTVTTPAGCTYTASTTAFWLTLTGATGSGSGTVGFQATYNSGANRTATITVTVSGLPPQTVTVTQLSDGKTTTPGMFRPSNGFFYLRFSNTPGFADTSFFYGLPNDTPLAGDWNADGITTIGIFRAGQFFLRNSNTAGFADIAAFAITGTQPGDIPVVGDWDGNGSTNVGIYRPIMGGGIFLLRNSNTAGPADVTFTVATPAGSIPVAGDWDGDGLTTVGLYVPSAGLFSLYSANAGNAPIQAVFFGQAGDIPVVGDWNADGITTIGVVRPLPSPVFLLRNTNTSGSADLSINYGQTGDTPVTGKWQ